MFDLDLIEQDWKNNSFCLSEEEIIEIYRSDGATLNAFEEEWDKYYQKINSCMPEISTEERLLRAIFGGLEKEEEQRNKLIAETPKPKKRHLSKENQRKVVEGALYMVFDETRNWYNFFEGKLSMERIYYVCLESLMNSVKYAVHNEKPFFSFYVARSIERSIIKYVSRKLHLTYREVYEIIHYEYEPLEKINDVNLLFDYETREDVEKPSKIFYQVKNELYNEDYIENISSSEFMKDYKNALENLDETEKLVMELTFDSNGYRGLTSVEIAEYLGIEAKKVYNIRKKAIRTLRKDAQLNTYL